MAYVDLNPVRAGVCEQFQDCAYTSVQRRIKGGTGPLASLKSHNRNLHRPLQPVAGLSVDDLLDVTEAGYIELVQWTGEQA